MMTKQSQKAIMKMKCIKHFKSIGSIMSAFKPLSG